MKILFLANIPAPYRVEFFNELALKCDLTVLYELNYATDRDSNWKSKTNKKYKEIFLQSFRIRNDSGLCFSVLKYLNSEEYDLIIIGGYSTPTGMLSIQYLKLKRKMFILSADGGFIKNESKIKYFIKKYFISKAKYWLSTNKETDKYFQYYGANKKNIYRYCFTSISEDQIIKKILKNEEKEKIKKILGIKEKKIILSVGQFIHRKGYDILLKSCKDLNSEVGIYIVGGEANSEYLKLKKELNIEKINFIEFKNKEILELYYKIADVFVLPTREDIWGLVINEAMAYGIPIITTNKCGAGIELIQNGKNGYIVNVEDVDELKSKMVEILENEKLRAEMTIFNLDKIKEYTIENMVERHIKIFEKILMEVSNERDNINNSSCL